MTKDEMIVMLTEKVLSGEARELDLAERLNNVTSETLRLNGYITDIQNKIGYDGHPGNLAGIITG